MNYGKLYAKGASFERQIMKKLEGKGLYAIRTAGSHSIIDIVAFHSNYTILIQAKASYLSENQQEAILKELASKLGNKDRVVQVYSKDKKGHTIIREAFYKSG